MCVSSAARTPFPCNVTPSHPRIPRTILTSLQGSLHPAIYTLAQTYPRRTGLTSEPRAPWQADFQGYTEESLWLLLTRSRERQSSCHGHTSRPCGMGKGFLCSAGLTHPQSKPSGSRASGPARLTDASGPGSHLGCSLMSHGSLNHQRASELQVVTTQQWMPPPGRSTGVGMERVHLARH